MKKQLIEFCGECMSYVDDTCPIITHCVATEKPPTDCPLEADLQPIYTTKDTLEYIERAEKAESTVTELVGDGLVYLSKLHTQRKEVHTQIAVLVDRCEFVHDGEGERYCPICLADIKRKHSPKCFFNHIPAEATKLLEKVKRYEEDLKFYADDKNWKHDNYAGTRPAVCDKGKRARDSIESQERKND